MSAKARSDLTVLKLPFVKMQALRDKYDDLDKILGEYEAYLDENGLPYCDYKLYRNKHLNMGPKEKFQYGVKRIMRIVKSYRSTAFADLMEKVREKIRNEKKNRESRRRSTILRSVPLTAEERTQQILIDLVGKVENLKEFVQQQDIVIRDLRDELCDKIEQLRCYQHNISNSSKNNVNTTLSPLSVKSNKVKPKVDRFVN